VEVEMTRHVGFCFGVRRAIRIAGETKRCGSALPVYTYGPLVHNASVIERLGSEGIESVEDLTSIPRGCLVIRSHGVPPETRLEALRLGFTIVDATCPLVRKIHDVVGTLKAEGYRVVIVGRSDHPEVVGIAGHAGEDCVVIESLKEVSGLSFRRKTGVVVQTTASLEQFREIVASLLSCSSECRVYNTICFETLRRQQEAGELAARVDAMVVAGGCSSSNTARLVDICREAGAQAIRVEKPEDLQRRWFSGMKRIGVTAGTSTPDEVITAVRDILVKF
jgi:4-hydroxy-3-methylbut-2-enyl diphosphate reductase